MSESYIGQIRPFAFPFAPKGWALCNGQLLPINSNQALFALLGTMYGGNGTTTFALPNLQGRTAAGLGTSASDGINYAQGLADGLEAVTLTTQQIPAHVHATVALASNAPVQPIAAPGPGTLPAQAQLSSGGQAQPAQIYGTGPANGTMAPQALANAGANQGHPNMQPFQVINFCICLQGIFPSRN